MSRFVMTRRLPIAARRRLVRCWCAVTLIAATCLAAAGCRREPATASSDWPPLERASLSESQTLQLQQADRAREALFSALRAELASAISQRGAAAAISVCAERAPRLAAEIGEQHELKMGRTSFRLRNPVNQPPKWAASAIAARQDQPTQYAGPGGVLGVLHPIHLQATCLLCHGPPSMVDESVKKAIAERYPTDEATGFRDGDLRGWFWAEVPGQDAGG